MEMTDSDYALHRRQAQRSFGPDMVCICPHCREYEKLAELKLQAIMAKA